MTARRRNPGAKRVASDRKIRALALKMSNAFFLKREAHAGRHVAGPRISTDALDLLAAEKSGSGSSDSISMGGSKSDAQSLATSADGGYEPPDSPPSPSGVNSEPSERDSENAQRLGAALVAIAFSIAIAGGIGFLFVYWTGGNNMLLGSSLAVAFGGFGIALVLAAHWLIRQTEVSAPREPLTSSAEERESVYRDFYPGKQVIRRRKLLTWMSAAVMGTLAAAAISVLRSFFGESPYGPALMSRIWRRGDRLVTEKGDPVSVNSLQTGSSVVVYPEKRLGYVSAQTVLLRVQEQYLQLPKKRAAWAPMGYLAYSRVCTHAGCPVGLFEAQNDLLLCPCHQSTFNVMDGAQPTGGPAARPLPQLPLYVDGDGNLRAGGDFTEPPGPSFWSIP
jgi:ubiquinol-cytochrome c reductase iron-sulfur subunit